MIDILLFISISIIVHEAGHFIAGKVFKLHIASVQLFLYPIIFVFFKGTLFKIGFIPIVGYVNALGIYKLSRSKQIIYYLSGILMNSILLLYPNNILFTINVYMIIVNLIPFKNSDGKKILNLL